MNLLPIVGLRVTKLQSGYAPTLSLSSGGCIQIEDEFQYMNNHRGVTIDPHAGNPDMDLLRDLIGTTIVTAGFSDTLDLYVTFSNGGVVTVVPNHDGYESWNVNNGDYFYSAKYDYVADELKNRGDAPNRD